MTEQHPADAAIAAIENAPLSATAYRAARRLLDQADIHNGYVRLTHARLMDVCGVTKLPSARRLLGNLKGQGIIHYTINSEVHVTFSAWACETGSPVIRNGSKRPDAMIRNGSQVIRNRSVDRVYVIRNGSHTRRNGSFDAAAADARAESDHPRSDSDHPRSESDQNGLPIGNGWYTDPVLGEEDTNHGNSPPTTNGDSDSVKEATAVGLLTSGHVGLSVSEAKRLAATYPFQEIRRQVFHWLPEAEKGKSGTGGLITRIEKPWHLPEPTAEMRRHPLWQQFRLPSEREADEAVEADIHDAMAAQRERWQEAAAGPEDQPDPDPAQPTGLWSQVLAEIGELVHPDTMDALSGSRLEEAGEVDGKPLYRIVLAYPERRSYIENRMGIMLRRTLGMVAGHPVLIEVEAEEQREEIES